ncbi:glycosyltransferase family 4 protein [Paenarthrobacter nitroguajacolicus]|uniref:glycosyltransferase family 4 protein n=1 Tax=Paenarthrobacter nitroguajacolicus TaxID=211146 RepID=UPI003433E57F
MKILVYPHDLRIGGSQINAIDLGAAVRDLGHDVAVFGQPGPLVESVRRANLEFIPAPTPRKRPSPAAVRALSGLVRRRGLDILHGYEWPPALECLLASRLAPGSLSVATVMSMSVAPFIPKTMPLVVGTAQILEAEAHYGRQRLQLLEPPVDVEVNSVQAVSNGRRFRRQFGLEDNVKTIVCVTRLAVELKLEGILSAMDAVAGLARNCDVRLVIVGDGPGMRIASAKASSLNKELQRNIVVLTGELADPRGAYAVADIVLGMGGSALRGLSFGKPLVVQGERGYWKLLTPETLPEFLWQGWYGVGDRPEQGLPALTAILAPLLEDAAGRERLGSFGRQVVEQRFSMQTAAQIQMGFYQKVLEGNVSTSSSLLADAAAASRYVAYVGLRRFNRYFGQNAADDFNASPVASKLSRPVSARSAP